MGINTYDGSGLSEKERGFLGLDIGSVSLNTVLMDKDFNIIENYYDYVHGKPFHILYERLTNIFANHSPNTINGIVMTGSGGSLAPSLSVALLLMR